MCILDYVQITFFYLRRFLNKLADDQCSSITKDSIYYVKHMYIQPFSMEMDWPEMEVSAMFHSCRYCIYTWYGRLNPSFFRAGHIYCVDIFQVTSLIKIQHMETPMYVPKGTIIMAHGSLF